jgi:addiction module RelE/StbE family toxin
MNIFYGKQFTKDLKKLYKSQPKQARSVIEKLKLFTTDHDHPSLRLHKLSGNLKDFYSISVKTNLRIIFSMQDSDTAALYRLGTHDEVYQQD